MGMLVEPHEIYFGNIFERFNRRFGPAQPAGGQSVWHSGGIAEIAELQKEFRIFREGRPFVKSAALLGLTGSDGGPSKDRWLEYLLKLPKMDSDTKGVNGDVRIVRAILKNLRRDVPLPCFMRAYDGRTKEPGLVTVTEEHPVFYLESVTFLTISLPMRPSQAQQASSTSPRPQTSKRAPSRRKQAS